MASLSLFVSIPEVGLLGEPSACLEVLFAFVRLSPDIELVPLNPRASLRLLGVRASSGVRGLL